MKRYLFILLVAALALVSCDTEISINNKHVVFFNDNIDVETTESSATIKTLKPYILSGTTNEEVVVYLEYWAEEAESAKLKVEQYAENFGYITFTIEDLLPETTYCANIVMGCVDHNEIEVGEVFSFATTEHIPVAEYSCDVEIEAKGLYADVVLSNVQFTIDAEAQPIESVVVEYRRKLSSGGEWIAVIVGGSTLKNGATTIRIPANGEEYLEEYRQYSCRVTIIPEDANYEHYSTTMSFETKFAEVVADIATPEAEINGDNLSLSVESAKVYFDGIELDDYYNLRYGFIYREQGDGEFMTDADFIEVEYDEVSGMSLSLPLSIFEEGATYEFYGAVIAGAKMPISESAVVTIPVKETPTPPAPPTPPVSGDADTTALAGEWHLTEWRGIEPSFDVYLSITEDGVVSLFQRIDSRLWETFYSVVAYEDGIIAGEYTDGVKWAHAYYVEVNGNTMTWTSTTDSSEVSVYTRCTLPDVTNPDIRVTSELRDTRFL